MDETWIILGATSSMARALARALAARGATLILAGRDLTDMKATAADCTARGAADAHVIRFDARKPATFTAILELAEAQSGVLNAAVLLAPCRLSPRSARNHS